MRSKGARASLLAMLVAGFGVSWAAPASAQWEIKTEDGKTSVKFGYLLQMRAESEELANGETAENLFFRRLRLIWGGKLAEKWAYFIETDSPNLGKSDAAGNKDASDVFIQDAFVTYDAKPSFKADFGLILIPLSRNSLQSAATQLASDYGPYSFLNSGPTRSRVGRDYGAQLRGYLAKDHFEYRVGVFDGARGANASEDLRFVGRVAYNFFDTETAFFYTGNNLGAKRQLAIGAGVDVQDDYQAIAADLFYDQPIGKDGNAVTFQADLMNYDGGDTFAALPEQDTLMFELGYLFGKAKIQPWVQFSTRDFAAAGSADEDQLYVGVNYRAAKHNTVARIAFGKLGKDGADDRDVIQLTLQLFRF